MGRYDDITPDQLRSDLVAFARLILRLDREDGVLASPAEIQRILGELRQKLFAYEIRATPTGREDPEAGDDSSAPPSGRASEESDPAVRESLKVVREAIRRREEMIQEWEETQPEDRDDDE